jgi:AcrR family transcriptional regulator
MAILTAASSRFANASYDQVGIRDIAGDAGIDPALVYRYFACKEQLFACVIEQLGDKGGLLDGPRSDFGARAAHQVIYEEHNDQTLVWLGLLLRAVSSPKATDVLRRKSQALFFEPLTEWIGGENAQLKAHLTASVLMGLSVLREATGERALSSAQTELLYLWLAEMLQSIIER